MDKEIIISNGKTEITVNEQEISVSAPDVLITVMTNRDSTSVTTVTRKRIDCAVSAASSVLTSESH